MNEKIRAINDKGGKSSLQLHHEKITAAGEKKADMRFVKNTVWHRIQYWKSSDQHSHHDGMGWKHETHKKKNTNKFNTHFTKTHYKQTLERNENGRNVQVFLAAEWWMQQRCYFWRGMKTYFSSLLMMLICSQSPNMQMKCATTIKWIVLRRWGTVQAACLQNRDGAQLCDLCCTLCACNRAARWHVTSRHSTRSHVWAWPLGRNFWTISS